jgi:hypothetical protein
MEETSANKSYFSDVLWRGFVIFLIQILNYIKYSLMLPFFGSYLMLILSMILVIQKLFSATILSNIIFSFANFYQGKSLSQIFAWFSLVAYIVGTSLEYLFKIKIKLSLNKKNLIIFSIITILGIMSLSYLFTFYLTTGQSILYIIFFIVFFGASLPLYLVSGVFIIIINDLQKTLEQGNFRRRKTSII